MSSSEASKAQQLLLPLLLKSARGDHQAFTQLYQKTSDRMYAVALRLLRSKDLAEDVMQESYVRIWHNASEYSEERGNVFTWMVTILRYRAIDRLRALSRAAKHDPFEDDIASDITPAKILESAKDSDLLQGCMEELGDQHRHSIALAFFDGLTHQQLSERLKAPLGTVKSRIRRGLLLLRRCLNNELQQT